MACVNLKIHLANGIIAVYSVITLINGDSNKCVHYQGFMLYTTALMDLIGMALLLFTPIESSIANESSSSIWWAASPYSSLGEGGNFDWREGSQVPPIPV